MSIKHKVRKAGGLRVRKPLAKRLTAAEQQRREERLRVRAVRALELMLGEGE